MYRQFFGLKENPFNVTPDPRYLYLTPHTEEALACLRYCVQLRKGFVLLTGDVGTGKTTLLNKLLEWLHEEQVASAFVFNPRLNPFQFLDYALSDFGVNCASRLKSAILSELNQWLLERYQAGSTAVLIVDEAQDASPELLEEIRLLANLETPSGKLLQIVLSGQQELEMKLRLPEFRQLRQRIPLRCKTYPLSLEEVHEYVAKRLQIAGSDGRQIFASEALDALHFYSEGIPRVINILCEDSLINAFADHKSSISKDIIEGVAHELELDLYPPTAPPQLDQQPEYPPHREPRASSAEGGDATEVSTRRQPPPSLPPTRVSPTPPGAPPVVRDPSQVQPPARGNTAPPRLTTLSAGVGPEQPASPAFASEDLAPQATPSAALFRPREAPANAFKPQPGPPAAESIASDDELVQSLKTAPPPRPQPPQPAAKPQEPAARSFVISPAPKAGRDHTQGWMLWAAVVFATLAGIIGAILILHRHPAPERVAQVAPPPAPAASDLKSVASTAEHNTAPTPSPSTPVPAALRPEQPVVQPPPSASLPGKPEETRPQVRLPKPHGISVSAANRTQQAAADPFPAAKPTSGAGVGGLVVTANIDGAAITLDKQTSSGWVTPHSFSGLPMGRHRVVVSKPGYDDVTAQIVIQEGRSSTFRAQLTPAGGEINIITNPPGLDVAIDGGPFQSSPLQATVGVGPHTYRIKLPNSQIYEGSFEMRTGAIITRKVDFSAGEWLLPSQQK